MQALCERLLAEGECDNECKAKEKDNNCNQEVMKGRYCFV